MRRLELDFLRVGGARKRIGSAFLAVGVMAAVLSGALYVQLADELASAEAKVHQSTIAARRSALAARPRGDMQRVALEMKRAGEVAVQLKLPWNELFASVEAAATPDVALLSIESDTGGRRVKIAAEARDPGAMLEYLRFLGAQPGLANVYLQNHQVQQQDPQKPVRFVLGADWDAVLR
jgi:Tfp pilus assembly protein PilN